MNNTIISIEEKLRRLNRLQIIDSKIDEIRTLQGELPEEVQDLKDELAGLEKRVNNLKKEIDDSNTFIENNNTKIQESKTLIERYTTQMDSVKNNREYSALTKEIEMQNLEIELANKRIREAKKEIDSKASYLKESEGILDGRKNDLVEKEKELKIITAETAKQEETLIKDSETAAELVEDRLLVAYKRIRKTYRNGLAVVSVDRDSCGGCFGKIPPQRQLELKQRKKIILCEHCGRILVDRDIEEEAIV